MSVSWYSRETLIQLIPRKIKPVNVILDIGCGIYPQKYIKPAIHICCDPHKEYLEHFRKSDRYKRDAHFVLINASWQQSVQLFPSRSVDSVFLLDVIEHLPKAEGRTLLRKSESIARKQVIIFTPLGFIPQEHRDGKDAWGLHGGVYQEHRSGWFPKDFDGTWTIYGAKRYHFEDNMGKLYSKPYGAFWAIKNIKGQPLINAIQEDPGILRKMAHRVVDKVFDTMNRMFY